jgi:hypothetical protein
MSNLLSLVCDIGGGIAGDGYGLTRTEQYGAFRNLAGDVRLVCASSVLDVYGAVRASHTEVTARDVAVPRQQRGAPDFEDAFRYPENHAGKGACAKFKAMIAFTERPSTS